MEKIYSLYHRNTKNHKRLLQTIISNRKDNLEHEEEFLEMDNFSGVNQEEIKNKSRSITSNVIEYVKIIKNAPNKT